MAAPDEISTYKTGAHSDEALSLNFVTERGPLKVMLPAAGSLVIGRLVGADVRLDHRSVSRRHARVSVGDAVTVEDLGSSNGTSFQDRVLAEGEKVTVRPGEVFFVGEVPCFLQGGARDPQRSLWTVGRMLKKLDARSAADPRPTDAWWLARVRVEGAPVEGFESKILAVVGADDKVSPVKSGSEALVLLAGRDEAEVEVLLTLLRARVGGPGRSVRVGVAAYPRDGADARALVERTRVAIEDDARVEGGPDVVVIAPAMRRLYEKLTDVARGSISVLLLGEMGVGKEVFASQVHALSARASKPYVKFNCAAFCETLVDAELFGYEKGAFTGATAARAGLIEAADKGTVFLDEVGELSPAIQAKLLRVLEARCVRRLGATEEKPVDVRFVAATNRDLARGMKDKTFREDLYYRLAGVTLEIPPLRERALEIAPLAQRFLDRAAAREGLSPPPRFTPEALVALHRHAWPGNLRELRNAVERAVLFARGGDLTPDHLELGAPPASVTVSGAPQELPASEQDDRVRVIDALERCAWNQSEAARQLGISRKSLIARIEKYKLPRPRKGREEH